MLISKPCDIRSLFSLKWRGFESHKASVSLILRVDFRRWKLTAFYNLILMVFSASGCQERLLTRDLIDNFNVLEPSLFVYSNQTHHVCLLHKILHSFVTPSTHLRSVFQAWCLTFYDVYMISLRTAIMRASSHST